MDITQPGQPLPETPDWVPGAVLYAATIAYWGATAIGQSAQAAAIVRLVTDPRMKRVWEVLASHSAKLIDVAGWPDPVVIIKADSIDAAGLLSDPAAIKAIIAGGPVAMAIFENVRDGVFMQKKREQQARHDRYLAEAGKLDRMAEEIWSAGVDVLKNRFLRPDPDLVDRRDASLTPPRPCASWPPKIIHLLLSMIKAPSTRGHLQSGLALRSRKCSAIRSPIRLR
jgi:hypothetical protein